MLIAVTSDTHRDMNSINKIISTVEKADILIHLGDNIEDALYLETHFKGEIYYVRGNCDYDSLKASEKILDIGGIKILITHGHKYGVKHNYSSLLNRAKELGVDIALFGHTHMPLIEEKDNIWLINPGSAALPRVNYRSIAFIDIVNGKIIPYIHRLED